MGDVIRLQQDACARAGSALYARILAGQFAAVAEEWGSRCSTLGKQVTINMGTRRVRGRAEALDENGALLLRTEHGRIERIIGGEVTLTK